MNRELKEKWVAALRSGEYKQGSAYLSKNGTYCCLGVLCEIMNVPKASDRPGYYDFGYMFCDRAPHTQWAEDYGIDTKMDTLIRMNDGLEGTSRTFDEIADYIEKEL